MIDNNAIIAKMAESRVISPNVIPIPDFEITKNPAARKRISSIASRRIYLMTGFIDVY
jgi:hypothetical protein